ncbi:MAG: CapA family protein [Bacillota bacterium]|nr:CapA family protein [Bacillota bacterium]
MDNNEIKSITINAVGDCSIGNDEKYPYLNSFNYIFEKVNRDYSFFLKNVRPIFEKDDLTIANLETTLTNTTNRMKKRFNFKGDPSYVKILNEGSVEVVNVANNHIYDYLQAGYIDTIINLEKAGLKYFGSDVFPEFKYENKLIEEIKGLKVGFLGYICWPKLDIRKKLKEDLAYMRENTNLIIVSFHWGKEFNNYPTSSQRKIAYYAIDNGADLILGHHPHVIQGIENYKNKNIIYSLGNFCFGGQINFKDKDTFIYQHTFTFNDDVLIKETNEVIPCAISSLKNKNNCQPIPLEGKDKIRVLRRIKKYSQGL